MSEAIRNRCDQCQRLLENDWTVCPWCSYVVSPRADQSKLTTLQAQAQASVQRDTSGAGLLLTGIGVACAFGLLQAIAAGVFGRSIEAILVIGALVIAIIVVGMVLSAGGKSKAAGIASGIVGGFVAALSAILLGFFAAVAFILYLIHDCLKALGG